MAGASLNTKNQYPQKSFCCRLPCMPRGWCNDSHAPPGVICSTLGGVPSEASFALVWSSVNKKSASLHRVKGTAKISFFFSKFPEFIPAHRRPAAPTTGQRQNCLTTSEHANTLPTSLSHSCKKRRFSSCAKNSLLSPRTPADKKDWAWWASAGRVVKAASSRSNWPFSRTKLPTRRAETPAPPGRQAPPKHFKTHHQSTNTHTHRERGRSRVANQ